MTKFEDFARHTVAMYQMFLAAQGAGSETEMPPLTDPLPVEHQYVLAAALAAALSQMEQPVMIIAGAASVTDPEGLLPREYADRDGPKEALDGLLATIGKLSWRSASRSLGGR